MSTTNFRLNQLVIQEANMSKAFEGLKVQYADMLKLVKTDTAKELARFPLAARQQEEAAGKLKKIKNQIDSLNDALGSVRNKIDTMQQDVPLGKAAAALVAIPAVTSVTDHAVVKWIERRLGVDIDDIKAAMRADAREGVFVKFKDTPQGTGLQVRSPSGMTYLVGKHNGVIVTTWGEAYHKWNGEASLESAVNDRVEETG